MLGPLIYCVFYPYLNSFKEKNWCLELIFYDFPWDYPQISPQRYQKRALCMSVFMHYIGLSLCFQSFQSQWYYFQSFPLQLILVWNKWAPCAFIYIALNRGQKQSIASPSSSWFPAISLENLHSFSDEVKRDSLPSLFLNGGFGISFPQWASHEWALNGTGPLKLVRSNKLPSSLKCAA